MSHLLDLDGVWEKLVVLEHFSAGSRAYCAKRLTGSEQDSGDGAIDEYWSWVKGIVCNYALDCSIKFRVLQDSIRPDLKREELKAVDERSRVGLQIGSVIHGVFRLTLRESCNKIIHARSVVPEWTSADERGVTFKFWDGTLRLSGEQDSALWEMILNVADWARAMQRFIGEIERSEAVEYVGQDWYPKR